VVDCPVCGEENPEEARACGVCGLARSLFEPVRTAVGPAGGGRPDPALLAEILEAVGEAPATVAAAGELAFPARFPAGVATAAPPRARPAPRALPELPALPPGDPTLARRRQIDELLTLGRRLHLPLEGPERRMREAILANDTAGFEEVRRHVFVIAAAELAEALEIARAQRAELTVLLGAGTPEAELASAEEALGSGDLWGAERRLRGAQEALARLEETWATVQILALEGDLLLETIRELGGDPSPALGPFAAGRRRARAGDRAAAEPLLARSLAALWHLLAPRLLLQIRSLRRDILRAEGERRDTSPAAHALHQLARDLRQRNFGAAIVNYRSARDAIGHLAAPAPPPAPPPAPSE
jgi:hypothetical protein